MKKFATIILLFMALVTVHAQTSGIDPNAPVSKDAKAQAKKLAKEGWTAPAGGQVMERQINMSMLMQMVQMQDADGNAMPRYLHETAEATSSTEEMARNTARTLCMGKLTQSLQSHVEQLIEKEISNRQVSATDAQTKESIKSQMQASSKACLNKPIQVLCFSKKEGGKWKVQIQLACDLAEVHSAN